MAAIFLYIPDRDAERPDGLCPRCFNPSLKRYTLTKIDIDGLTPIGDRTACRDCNIWTTPNPARPAKKKDPNPT